MITNRCIQYRCMARQTLLYQIILGCMFTILNVISINRYLGIFINFSLISIFVLFFMLRFSKHKLQGYKNLYMLKCMHVSQNGSVFIKDIDIKPILYIYNEVRPKFSKLFCISTTISKIKEYSYIALVFYGT